MFIWLVNENMDGVIKEVKIRLGRKGKTYFYRRVKTGGECVKNGERNGI